MQASPEQLVPGIPALAAAVDLSIEPLRDVVMLNNHNYRVTADGRRFLLRIASPQAGWLGIRRAEEEACARAAAAAGVAPEVVWSDADGNHLLTWIDGRHWTADDYGNPAQRARLVAVLRRLREVRQVAANGRVTDRIGCLLASARELGLDVSPALQAQHRRLAEFDRERRARPDFGACLCHNDLWANNFLDDGQQLWLVDWEFGGLGDGLYDLATTAWAAGWDDASGRDLLLECGYAAADWDAFRRTWDVVTLFEGSWALVMHGLRGSAGFDYLGASQRCLARLDSPTD